MLILKTDAMNERSLSRLYLRLQSERARTELDAQELVDALSGAAAHDTVAAQLAASPAHADLARMLKALEADSAAFAADVNRTQRAHPMRGRDLRRAAAGVRHGHVHRLRWAGGVAACLAVALGLSLSLRSTDDASRWQDVAAAARSVPQQDRIFASNDVIFSTTGARAHAPPKPADQLFSSSFAAGG